MIIIIFWFGLPALVNHKNIHDHDYKMERDNAKHKYIEKSFNSLHHYGEVSYLLLATIRDFSSSDSPSSSLVHSDPLVSLSLELVVFCSELSPKPITIR